MKKKTTTTTTAVDSCKLTATKSAGVWTRILCGTTTALFHGVLIFSRFRRQVLCQVEILPLHYPCGQGGLVVRNEQMRNGARREENGGNAGSHQENRTT